MEFESGIGKVSPKRTTSTYAMRGGNFGNHRVPGIVHQDEVVVFIGFSLEFDQQGQT